MKSNKQSLSPKKYIINKSAKLPYHECLINEEWEESGMASIFISKKMPSGKYIIGLYMVDIFCLGLKNTYYQFGLDYFQYKELLEKMYPDNNNILCDITKAHNIIFGAIDFAEELGFKPEKDFRITEYLLDTSLIDEGIDDIEFGRDGKPYYVAGPYDDTRRIINILRTHIGEGNFDFTY